MREDEEDVLRLLYLDPNADPEDALCDLRAIPAAAQSVEERSLRTGIDEHDGGAKRSVSVSHQLQNVQGAKRLFSRDRRRQDLPLVNEILSLLNKRGDIFRRQGRLDLVRANEHMKACLSAPSKTSGKEGARSLTSSLKQKAEPPSQDGQSEKRWDICREREGEKPRGRLLLSCSKIEPTTTILRERPLLFALDCNVETRLLYCASCGCSLLSSLEDGSRSPLPTDDLCGFYCSPLCRALDVESIRSDSSLPPALSLCLQLSCVRKFAKDYLCSVNLSAMTEKRRTAIGKAAAIGHELLRKRAQREKEGGGVSKSLLSREAVQRYLAHIWANSHRVRVCSSGRSSKIEEAEAREIGSALSLVVSAANHSCLPNAFVSFSAGNEPTFGVTCSLIAERVINKGEEIAISYGPLASRSSLKDRERECIETLGFVCWCSVCFEDRKAREVTGTNSGDRSNTSRENDKKEEDKRSLQNSGAGVRLRMRCLSKQCSGELTARSRGDRSLPTVQCSKCASVLSEGETDNVLSKRENWKAAFSEGFGYGRQMHRPSLPTSLDGCKTLFGEVKQSVTVDSRVFFDCAKWCRGVAMAAGDTKTAKAYAMIALHSLEQNFGKYSPEVLEAKASLLSV